MQPTPNHAPWQIAAIPTSGRVAAAALALLAVDSIFVWSMTSMLEAAALTVIPAVVAIRVIRGFPRSREMAAATFAAGVAVGVAALFRLGVGAGQTGGAIVVAIVLAASGLLTLAWSWVLDRRSRQPVITMPRWPSTPVAVRSPSRYRSHRRYR